MRDIIAKERGKSSLIMKWSTNEYHGSVPAEWHGLKDHIDDLLYQKFIMIQDEQDERERSAILKQQQAFFDEHRDLVSKFLEIAERKVSILDEYGEENWDALPQEIVTLILVIAKRQNVRITEKEVRQSFEGDHRWVSERLEADFREYHAKLKATRTYTSAVNGLTGVEFETWITKLLRERGFEVQGTPMTGDQGADLIAKKDGKTVIIQAKCYQGAVGNKAVQEVIGALAYYGGDEGWVVTNASFTPSAKALAQKTNVKLIDGHHLKEQKLG